MTSMIQAMSLTEYLGRLRAFVDALHTEAVTVATYVRRDRRESRRLKMSSVPWSANERTTRLPRQPDACSGSPL